MSKVEEEILRQLIVTRADLLECQDTVEHLYAIVENLKKDLMTAYYAIEHIAELSPQYEYALNTVKQSIHFNIQYSPQMISMKEH